MMRFHRPVFTALGLALLLAACGAPAPSNDPRPSSSPTAEPGAPPAAQPGPVRVSAIPADFHGVYDESREACGRPSEYRLTVSADALRFHESIGVVRSVTVEGPVAIHVAADFQGEGESWRAVHELRLTDGGARLAIRGEGSSLTRIRCGPAPSLTAAAPLRWNSAVSGEGAALFLAGSDGRSLTLFCPKGSGDLIVNVPAFRAVGSEERMTFGAGGTATTLVAEPRGDAGRGGVSGRGPLPAELPSILAGPEGISVNYGAQDSGPHAPPPGDLVRDFLAGCRGRA